MSLLEKLLKSIRYSFLFVLFFFSGLCLSSPDSSTLVQDGSRFGNIIMYKHFDNESLNLYDHDSTDLRAKCEYYKSNALFYCRDGHSSSYEERENCVIVNKQRWCMCMGKRNDCFRDRYFYW